MNYEEALKIGYDCVHHDAMNELLESSYINEVANRIATELMKAFQHGIDWSNEVDCNGY